MELVIDEENVFLDFPLPVADLNNNVPSDNLSTKSKLKYDLFLKYLEQDGSLQILKLPQLVAKLEQRSRHQNLITAAHLLCSLFNENEVIDAFVGNLSSRSVFCKEVEQSVLRTFFMETNLTLLCLKQRLLPTESSWISNLIIDWIFGEESTNVKRDTINTLLTRSDWFSKYLKPLLFSFAFESNQPFTSSYRLMKNNQLMVNAACTEQDVARASYLQLSNQSFYFICISSFTFSIQYTFATNSQERSSITDQEERLISALFERVIRVSPKHELIALLTCDKIKDNVRAVLSRLNVIIIDRLQEHILEFIATKNKISLFPRIDDIAIINEVSSHFGRLISVRRVIRERRSVALILEFSLPLDADHLPQIVINQSQFDSFQAMLTRPFRRDENNFQRENIVVTFLRKLLRNMQRILRAVHARSDKSALIRIAVDKQTISCWSEILAEIAAKLSAIINGPMMQLNTVVNNQTDVNTEVITSRIISAVLQSKERRLEKFNLNTTEMNILREIANLFNALADVYSTQRDQFSTPLITTTTLFFEDLSTSLYFLRKYLSIEDVIFVKKITSVERRNSFS